MNKAQKMYLGDAVYAAFEPYTLGGGMLTLTTEDGARATNTIHLEPEVWGALQQFMKALVGS